MSWYYSKQGTQLGPISEEELSAKAKSGEVAGSDLIWKEGMPDWKPLSQVSEFSGLAIQGGPPAVGSGMGNVPLAKPPAYSSSQVGTPVPNYLWQAIVVTLLCCLPFGGVGIVYAAQVDGMVARGDMVGANAASQSAKTWTMAGFITGLVITVVWFAIIMLGALGGV